MKIYVVLSGYYGYYSIMAVFLDENKAFECRDNGNEEGLADFEVQEWETED